MYDDVSECRQPEDGELRDSELLISPVRRGFLAGLAVGAISWAVGDQALKVALRWHENNLTGYASAARLRAKLCERREALSYARARMTKEKFEAEATLFNVDAREFNNALRDSNASNDGAEGPRIAEVPLMNVEGIPDGSEVRPEINVVDK